jgi:hypothetical protein
MRLALAALLLLGCAPTGAVVKRPNAQLAIRCNVADARVYLDDAFVGRAGDLRTLPVVAGARRVELRADGWFSAYRDVQVAAGARAELSVELRKVPDVEPAE